MKKFKIVTLAAVAVLGLGALGGIAVRANATSTSPSAAAVEPATGQPDGDNVQQGDSTTPDATAADPTTPEAAAAAAVERVGSEAPTSNDGAGGHADPAGNVDHQFDGAE